VWSGTLLLSALTEPVARSLATDKMAGGAGIDLATAGPVIVVTIALTSTLATISLVTLALTFFPTAGYERWIQARAARTR